MINKIFLVGFRTTGKSTLGKVLAEKIGWSFLDTDFLITQEAGEDVDTLTKKGSDWSKFRKLENQILKDLIEMENVVISCGGGVGVNDIVENDSRRTFGELNKETLKKAENTLVILLTSRDDVIRHRLYRKFLNKRSLPLLNGESLDPGASEDEQTMHKIKDSVKALEKRKTLYQQLADIEVDTSDFRIPRRLVNLNVVIGDPISQSLSPKMHNLAYKVLDIDSSNLFIPIRVVPEKLEKFINSVRVLDIKGVSVTLPHKESVIDYLDELDETAKTIGAVNTIINKDGKLIGYNTDWTGALTALEKRTKVEGKKVAILGSGGAAKAVAYGLSGKQAMVTIYNRNPDKAKSLTEKFNIEYKSLVNLETVKDCDIIINCTSVGMQKDLSLIPEDLINNNQIIFDIITTPKETKLIRNAKAKNAKVIYGYEMLLYQGVEQFKLYTGYEAPVKEMEEAIKNG